MQVRAGLSVILSQLHKAAIFLRAAELSLA
jgi:hypothetical protein